MINRKKKPKYPCHSRPKKEWCDYKGRGDFMGHTCQPPKQEYKWTFAMGTTSRMPNRLHHHYLILDLDTRINPEHLEELSRMCEHVFIQKTENGFHVYTDYILLFKQFEMLATYLGADKSWVGIGLKRGYWFLADKQPVVLPWPVERMILKYDKKTGRKKDTGRS